MQIVHGHRNAPAWAGAAVAIGNFDGVHLGHRALIDRARALADANGAVAVALTFDPHPSAVVGRGCPPMLSSLERRLEALEAAGLDAVVVEPFTMSLANLAPHAFVDDILIFALRARAIVVGYDFTYGQGRAGTTDALRAHGAKSGVEVAIVPAVEIGGEVASSTKIRGYLREGDVAAAARLLGRPWDIDGVVVHGAKRGRTIGIPTANIQPQSDLMLAPGIYACTLATTNGQPMPAVASLGRNPTFVEQGGLVLEVHVLDWDGDLYDQRVRATFLSRIRDELKFDSVDALIAQIHDDIAVARKDLQVIPPRSS
ncbi:MAG: bifunctional riboflavin kinase/FAD synthetase [Deltaproteobacteria bacterium]|nr:bifunctional riboflavin kinase/FAD synthetase [Deltaproteobacteria bacterium]